MPDPDLKVAFIHIPKTGGNTFRDQLRREMAPRREIVLNNADAIAKFRALTRQQRATFDLVSGHMPYGFDPELPRRFRYVTFLRHPVSRVISNYDYMMSGEPKNAVARRLREEGWSFRDFVTTKDPMMVDRLYAHLAFLGQPAGATAAVTMKELVLTAAERIYADFDFVGCLELYDESVVLMSERYGFALSPYERKNVTKAKHKHAISDEDRALVEERMQPEIELYAFAKRLLVERLARVEDLGGKVAKLRAPSPSEAEATLPAAGDCAA